MTASKKPRGDIGRQLLAALAKLASRAKGWKRQPDLTTCAIGVQCVAMSKVLRGVITLVLFVTGQMFWLPRSWQGWMFPGSSGDRQILPAALR